MGNFEIHKKPKKWNQDVKSFLSLSLSLLIFVLKLTKLQTGIRSQEKKAKEQLR